MPDHHRKMLEAAAQARQLEADQRKEEAQPLLAARKEAEEAKRQAPAQKQAQTVRQKEKKKPFDPAAALKGVRERLKIQRRARVRTSGLEKYRSELVAMHREGASLREMAAWLRHARHHKAARSTVGRFLAKLPELRTKKKEVVKDGKGDAHLSEPR